jgi:hypothetical protein
MELATVVVMVYLYETTRAMVLVNININVVACQVRESSVEQSRVSGMGSVNEQVESGSCIVSLPDRRDPFSLDNAHISTAVSQSRHDTYL